MAKPNCKRKTRSDKFPLTLHPTGQYCKKVKGKVYYFGSNKHRALQNYLEQATMLHAGRGSKSGTPVNNMALKTLCNLYLEHQESKVQTGELTAGYFSDQVRSLRKFVRFIGPSCIIAEISALDLQNYKRKLRKSYGSAYRVNLNIAIMKAVFHWARKNDVVQTIPNIDAVAKAKTIPEEKPIFSASQIQRLLDWDFPYNTVYPCLATPLSLISDRISDLS